MATEKKIEMDRYEKRGEIAKERGRRKKRGAGGGGGWCEEQRATLEIAPLLMNRKPAERFRALDCAKRLKRNQVRIVDGKA